MLKTIFFLIVFLSAIITPAESVPNNTHKDLTIVVSSCDKYVDCWEPFCKLLFRYWPSLKTNNKNVPIVLITNQKDFSYDRVLVYKTGEDKGWSSNLLKILPKIRTKYVLYLQEDYFFSAPFDDARLHYLFEKMKTEKIPHITIGRDVFFEKEKDYPSVKGTVIKGKHSIYRTSLQPALWEKKTLEWLLKENETAAWRFEIEGSTRSSGIMQPFLSVKENHPIHFVNACGAGYFTYAALEFLKKEGIFLKTISLPIDKDYPFTLWLRGFSSKASIRRLKLYYIWTRILGLWDPKFSETLTL